MKNLKNYEVLELSKEELVTTDGGRGFWATIGYYYGVMTSAQQTVMTGLINAQSNK